ncbi:hypothetical protein [Nocardia africana]
MQDIEVGETAVALRDALFVDPTTRLLYLRPDVEAFLAVGTHPSAYNLFVFRDDIGFHVCMTDPGIVDAGTPDEDSIPVVEFGEPRAWKGCDA